MRYLRISLVLAVLFFLQPSTAGNKGKSVVSSYNAEDVSLQEEAERLRKASVGKFGTLSQTLTGIGEVDYRHYDIAVRLYPAQHFYEEEATVVFRSRIAQLGEVTFIIWAEAVDIRSVSRGPDTLNYTFMGGGLTVYLRDTLGVGQEDSVRIVYSGYITPDLSRSLNYNCALDSLFSYSTYSPSVWYPAPLDRFSGSRLDERASGRIQITVPQNYRAVSNGALLDSSATDTTQTFTWGTPNDLFEFTFAAGPFQMSTQPYSGILLRCYDLDTTNAPGTLTTAASILNFYSQAFYPYPFEKLAIANHNQNFGYGSYSLVLMPIPTVLNVISHETAHEWWGHLVCQRFIEESWLSEGFATYASALYKEDSLGRDSMMVDMQRRAALYLAMPPGEDRPIIPTPFTSPHLYKIVYYKGSWVLHMLRGIVGDSTFFDIMRTYITTARDSSSTAAMFQNVAEQVSGRTLGWFFDEWLYRPGAPGYTYAWQSQQMGNDTFQLTLMVNQLDTLYPLFTMPIQTSIFTHSGRQDEWVWVDSPADTFQYLLNQDPDSVILDKDDWLLDHEMTRSGAGEVTEIPTSPQPTTLNRIYPNPFREGIWLEYSLGRRVEPLFKVYDVSGRLVRLLRGSASPGTGRLAWDGRDERGRRVPAGVYLIRLVAPDVRGSERVVVLK